MKKSEVGFLDCCRVKVLGQIWYKIRTRLKQVNRLSETRKILAIIDKEVVSLEFKANDRNKLSVALLDITRDHAKAIVVSLENKLYASAYALQRPLFECFVRGAWIQHCASEEQIAHVIKKDEFKLKLGEMLDAVEKKADWGTTLSQAKDIWMRFMHSYTHGGFQLIARRFKDGCIEHNVSEEEIADILLFVATISVLSFCELLAMTGDDKGRKELNEIWEILRSMGIEQKDEES